MTVGMFFTIAGILYCLFMIFFALPWSRKTYKDVHYHHEDAYLITIDDVPNEYTEQMLDILSRYSMKAYFFVTGSFVKGNDDVIERIIADGHYIGNHSYSHYFFFPISCGFVVRDIELNEEMLMQYGVKPVIVRTPHGYHSPHLMHYLRKKGMKFMYWDVMLPDFIFVLSIFNLLI